MVSVTMHLEFGQEKPEKSKADSLWPSYICQNLECKVCVYLISAECISDEQKRLSNGGEKDIGKYRPAVVEYF